MSDTNGALLLYGKTFEYHGTAYQEIIPSFHGGSKKVSWSAGCCIRLVQACRALLSAWARMARCNGLDRNQPLLCWHHAV